MKTPILLAAALALLVPGMVRAQNPPSPPHPPHHQPPAGEPILTPAHPHPNPQPEHSTSYLGVATAPVPPPLVSQLKLEPGFGLLVTSVIPDSPASSAGLQPNDVLLKLDDQLLIEPAQFAVLVRSRKPDDEITLELVRGGERMSVKIKVGQRSASAGHPHPKKFFMRSGDAPKLIIEKLENLKDRKKNIEGLKENLENLKEKIKTRSSDFAATRVDVQAIMDDDQARFELSTRDGASVFRVVEKDGSELFEGPVTTPEDREKVPSDYRGKLDQMEAIGTNEGPLFDVLMPAPAGNDPVMHIHEELLEAPSV